MDVGEIIEILISNKRLQLVYYADAAAVLQSSAESTIDIKVYGSDGVSL